MLSLVVAILVRSNPIRPATDGDSSSLGSHTSLPSIDANLSTASVSSENCGLSNPFTPSPTDI